MMFRVIIFWNAWFSAPHYGEFILHRLTLRSAIDQGIETRFDALENGVAAAIASRDFYVIANQNATIKLVEKQSQKLVRTIQTRASSRVVDLKVLKLRRQEFLVWMEENELDHSLGIFELHQVKNCCIQLFECHISKGFGIAMRTASRRFQRPKFNYISVGKLASLYFLLLKLFSAGYANLSVCFPC